ncbi:MAG: Hsp70 family protein [Actinocatenispora sp.]
MPGLRLSIDYGTSNTVAVLMFPDGRTEQLLFDGTPLLPSAVYVEPDGTLSVGRDAQRSARVDPGRYEPNPKRRIDESEIALGERGYPLADVVAAALRRVAQEAFRVAGQPAAELTMTCPGEWGRARRRVLADAATRADLPAPTMVSEPVAAATYFASVLGHQVPPGRCVVVYDLGGGTFDTCVLRREPHGFDELSHGGLDDFGGVDLDEVVVGRVGAAVAATAPEEWRRLTEPVGVADRRAFRMLWDDARGAKEALSRTVRAGLFVPLAERDIHVTREEFERAAAPALRRTAELTRATVRRARIRPDEVAGVFLVGGSSRVPMIATLVHQAMGVAPTVLEQPELVVALGALSATASFEPVVAPTSGTTASGTPASVAPASVAPASVAPASVAPASVAPVSGAPGPPTVVGPAEPAPMSGPGAPPPVADPSTDPGVPLRPSAASPGRSVRRERHWGVPTWISVPALALGLLLVALIPLVTDPGRGAGSDFSTPRAVLTLVAGLVILVGSVLLWLRRGYPRLARFLVPALPLIVGAVYDQVTWYLGWWGHDGAYTPLLVYWLCPGLVGAGVSQGISHLLRGNGR